MDCHLGGSIRAGIPRISCHLRGSLHVTPHRRVSIAWVAQCSTGKFLREGAEALTVDVRFGIDNLSVPIAAIRRKGI